MSTPFKITEPPLPQKPALPPTYEHPDVAQQRRRDILNGLLVLRIANACLVATFFQPDEYFQALEPAWAMVFGSPGTETGAWLTWEWTHGLRSSLHPTLVAILYRLGLGLAAVLHFPHPVRAQLLILLPALAQGVATACGEYATWRLAERVFGRNSRESWALIAASATSPWLFFTGTRTLSNSLEAALTAAGLAAWPWSLLSRASTPAARRADLQTLRWSVGAAAVAVVLRPTNALVWAPLTLWTLCCAPASLVAFLQDASVYGGGVLALTAALDYQYYGAWTLPAAKWLQYNLQQNLAVFYGVNRTDYYLTEGLPILLTTAVPFALIGLATYALRRFASEPGNAASTPVPSTHPHPPPAQAPSTILTPLAWTALTTLAALTAISHKEVRFLAPLLPPLLLLAAPSLARVFTPRPALIAAAITANLALAFYATRMHQSGPLALVAHLRHMHEQRNIAYYTAQPGAEVEPTTVGFLMPCHSTPWRSHLYYADLHAWALTCEPPVGLAPAARAAYVDEADAFYARPTAWLGAHLADSADVASGRRAWPQQLAFFNSLITRGAGDVSGLEMRQLLGARGYAECWRAFSSHVHDDWRREGDVVLWCQPEADDRTAL